VTSLGFSKKASGAQEQALASADVASLVQQARRGSGAALAALYDLHQRGVRQLARRLVGDDAVAEDLVQEIFERLPHALRGFQATSSLQTFMFAMVVNRTRQHLRGAIRRRRALRRLAEQPEPALENPDDNLHDRRLAAHVVRTLDRLPLAQRVAFVLCEIQDLTCAEAAQLVAIPEATVRTRLFHARRRLREILLAEGLAR
jgi:RNA polymerase sigma-70 factor (ECF subfamily)